ncbi:MAG: DnaT-like ssDNA-binding protein [Mycobacterium sp.]
MAVTVVATVGSATANSYDEVANITTYIEGRLNSSAWDSASGDTQNRAAVEATRTLELMPWRGTRVDATQALAWPREYVPIRDPSTASASSYYSSTAIPTDIKEALAELALEFVKAGTTDLGVAATGSNLKRKKIDVLEWEYSAAQVEGLQKFTRVMVKIDHYLEPTAYSNEVVRV